MSDLLEELVALDEEMKAAGLDLDAIEMPDEELDERRRAILAEIFARRPELLDEVRVEELPEVPASTCETLVDPSRPREERLEAVNDLMRHLRRSTVAEVARVRRRLRMRSRASPPVDRRRSRGRVALPRTRRSSRRRRTAASRASPASADGPAPPPDKIRPRGTS